MGDGNVRVRSAPALWRSGTHRVPAHVAERKDATAVVAHTATPTWKKPQVGLSASQFAFLQLSTQSITYSALAKRNV